MDKLDQSAENEFTLMWEINHENILKYYEHFDHEIRDKEYTCVITEYCHVRFISIKYTFYKSFINRPEKIDSERRLCSKNKKSLKR